MNFKEILIKKRGITIAIYLLMSVTFLHAQETLLVKGSVVDDKKQPLIGVSVTNEQAKGTVTDIDGHFTLKCTPNTKLKFSYVGYIAQTLPVTATMNVVLKSNEVSLDAVTVVGVGYGTMRKSDLTGAITSVSSDNLKKGVVSSAEQLLQGKVAGLTVIQGGGDPTRGSSMRLRGGTSLSASNGPLIVVDGVPGADFNAVQPSEIVSIDVLKDASAAAIYGSRGANGVIIVTTNREVTNKTMSYSGYMAIGKVANHLDLFSANQWRQYVRDNNVASAVDYGADTDWQKELEQTAISQSHNISFSSGSKESGLRGSITYLSNEGVIKKSKLDRLSGSVSAYQYGLNNKLKLEASLHVTADDWHTIDNSIFERAYNLNPTIPVMQNGAYTQVGGTNNNNPVELLMSRTDDNTRKRMLAYTKAELEIVKGLKGVANASYEYNTAQGRYYLPSTAFYGITDKGYGRRSLNDYTNMQIETYLTFDKQLNKSNKINLMAGYSYLNNMYEGFGAERRGFDSDLFGYNNLAAGQDYRTGDVYSYKGKSNLVSFFGRVNYNLKDRYMVTATLRRDGSSRFGANNKWGMFPSASAAWRISEEPIMKGLNHVVSNLKLRVGYGVTGNQDGIGEYKSLSLLGTGGSSYYDAASDMWKQSYGPTQNPNPDLKWESTAQTNIGLDFTLFGRLNGSIELYDKQTKDLLYTYDVPQPPYLYGRMLANVGDLSNKGIELTLNANIIKNRNFTWNANLSLAHNKQVVERLSNDKYQTDRVLSGSLYGLTGMSTTFSQVLQEGYAVGTFYGPVYEGIDENGKFILKKDDVGNVVNEVLGDVQPKMSMGFAMDFTIRNFDLNVSTYGMFGQKVLNATAMNISYPGRLPSYNVLDKFQTSGINDGPLFSSYWLEDASFLRIQSVTLGYSIPFKKLGFSKVRCYITGENLFTFTGYKGIDPEVSIDGLSRPGIDIINIIDQADPNHQYYPRPLTVSFGLNLSF